MTSDNGSGPDVSRYLDYLVTNRDFAAPAVEAALGSIASPASGRPLRVLDAGTGAGGALPGLRRLAGESGAVLAVDLDERAVAAARAWAGERGGIEFRVADLRSVAAESARAGGLYDLIWSSDVVWPATFDDPADVVAELAAALAPGGTLALFTTNYYQSMFLPGHSRLERLIRTASELTWGLPDDGAAHHERLGAWMRAAGLAAIAVHSFPLTALTARQPAAREYAERVVWPEMRHAVAAQGRVAGMGARDIARAEELLDPASPSWVGHDADTFIVQPTLLWVGRAAPRG